MNAYKTPLWRGHGALGRIAYLTNYGETSYERYFGSNLIGYSGGYNNGVELMFRGLMSGYVVVKGIKLESYETE